MILVFTFGWNFRFAYLLVTCKSMWWKDGNSYSLQVKLYCSHCMHLIHNEVINADAHLHLKTGQVNPKQYTVHSAIQINFQTQTSVSKAFNHL